MIARIWWMPYRIFKYFRSYFTLVYVQYLFTDKISGNRVHQYMDCYGDFWMKNSRWGFFRVYCTNKEELMKG